ncbi:MAG: hypothetical protein ACJAWP_000365 [Porticoccus sp.]|jgi:hypothetical protein|uniref:hypothetical protein n=1 Tax=Porticoccus sp. TaxID=2024853 RepID=UPI0039E24078
MIERIRQGAFIGTKYRHNPRFPELPLAGFGFLAHFVWEMLQVPWFTGMADASHGSVVWLCIRATGGDVLILMASFWLASIACGNRQWLLEGDRKPAVILVVTAFVVTIVLEWLATGPLERWAYADSMPIIPLLDVGLAPLLQWLFLPPLIMWLARRHMLGHIALRSDSSSGPVRECIGKSRP